jgi:hypothetical protein
VATPLVRLVRGRAVLVVCLALVTWLLSCLFSPQPQQLAKQTRQRPRILVPDEFQVAVIKGKFPALQIRMDDVAGKHGITGALTDVDKGDEGLRPPALRFDLFKWGQQGSGTLGFRPPAAGTGRPGTTGPYQGIYRSTQQHTRFSKPRNKPLWLPVNEAQGKTPVLSALPARLVIVAASFPYKQQVEEFKHALHLNNQGAVLTERVAGAEGKVWRAFRFDGVEVERMTLGVDGRDGQWQPLDVESDYRQFVIITNRSLERDAPQYAPILKAGRGLVMEIPAQLPEDLKLAQPSAARKAPDLVGRLKHIQKTLEKLAGEDRKDTPVDHCLLRFVDVTVESSKSYRYRLRVRMMNPNYAPDPKKRRGSPPQLPRDKVLKSDWVRVPLIVTVPPDQIVYALEGPGAGPGLNTWVRSMEPWRWTSPPFPPAQAPSQAAVQIHRWVDSYRPNPDDPHLQAVGEWLVAARILVERGEYVHDPAYKVPVPIKPPDLFVHELDDNPRGGRGEGKYLMQVEFGDESVLVDFEGGELAAVELLIMRPDGKMIARNSADDREDRERTSRSKAFTARIEKLRGKPSP